MKKTSNALLLFLTLGYVVHQTSWLIYATADAPDSRVILAQFEWEDVQHHISLADLKLAINKLPRNRRDELVSKKNVVEYLEELTDEKLKILDAIRQKLGHRCIFAKIGKGIIETATNGSALDRDRSR